MGNILIDVAWVTGYIVASNCYILMPAVVRLLDALTFLFGYTCIATLLCVLGTYECSKMVLC